MEYNSVEFYCLPPDMSYGSRELLLAMGWLLLTSNVLELSLSRKLRKSPMNMEFDVNVSQQVGDVHAQPVFKAGSLENSLNSILCIAGKIRHNVNAIAETRQARVAFATKIYKSSINSCGLPDLSVSETKLVHYPELLPEYLDSVKESSMLMETHMLWCRKCHIFWEWMVTVLAEVESIPQHNLISRRTLLHVLDTLQHAAKAHILRCQRVKECDNVTAKDNDSKFSAPLHEQSLLFIQGLPRCILEEKDKDTEISLLLTDSEKQLQEVKSSYEIKRAAVLQKLHDLAAQTDNVIVLFPSSLK